MNRISRLSLAIALMTLGAHAASASTAYGDLNNFDTVNDTGQPCHGFEIEIDDIHSTDITYTYDWNHYGAPRIREDNTDPAHPKVFIRYESAKAADGSWASYTAAPAVPLTPTDGHSCTNPAVNEGCEHFGVGYYGIPSAVKYNWLIDDGAGNLIHGPAVSVATPTWTYYAPGVVDPAAQVVAVIPAPVVPIPVNRKFGEPTWVKVIKTTSHNPNNVELRDLISDDVDGDDKAEWQNGEPDEVESEWKLLQINSDPDQVAKDELEGLPDDMGDGNETVTRRYEFYKYAAAANTLDGENGEAMCSEVDPASNDPADPNYNPDYYLHGSENESNVEVTDANGDPYFVDCHAQVVVGDYIGAQMAGFDAAAPLGLIDNIQDGAVSEPYTPRTVVVGGNTPIGISFTGNLPPGLDIDPVDGVLSGTPLATGSFSFTVNATDADSVTVTKDYTMAIVALGGTRYKLTVGFVGTGSGSVAGSGIACDATCDAQLDADTTVTLTATPAPGSVFTGWSGACSGTGDCVVTMSTDTSVSANFTRQYQLSASKTGAGTGTVSGNGIDCGATCTVNLDAGTAVNLTATPDTGSVFTGWSGGCSGTGACTTTLNADTSVSAAFELSSTAYSLTVATIGSGTVTSSPKVKGSINCGQKCSGSFTAGSNVTLTAKPKQKHVFVGWAGACSGTSLTCTLPMTSSQNVTANFN